MKKRTVVLYIGLAAMISMLLFRVPGYSQGHITSIEDKAFGDRQRPPAVFVHEEHNEKAELYECSVCHHLYEDGQKVEDESSEDEMCSGCHYVKGGDQTRPLMKAYHDLCKRCHQANKSGPITCGECHPRR